MWFEVIVHYDEKDFENWKDDNAIHGADIEDFLEATYDGIILISNKKVEDIEVEFIEEEVDDDDWED